MSAPQVTPTPLQELHDPIFARHGVRLLVKRDDLIHPLISGNKWRKLKYNLAAARRLGHDTLLSFGGAYSNHIHALAAAAHTEGYKSIGVIRGEAQANPTLDDARAWGMQLHFVSRACYRDRNSGAFLDALRRRCGDFYLLPEGGSNALAVRGCAEIGAELDAQCPAYDCVCCACGSAGTLAGIAAGLRRGARALGFAALRAGAALEAEVARLHAAASVTASAPWRIEHGYHGGGYARFDAALVRFMDEFSARHGIPLEPIYTAKLFYGLYAVIQRGDFGRGETVVALHSGGLQGLRGAADRLAALRRTLTL